MKSRIILLLLLIVLLFTLVGRNSERIRTSILAYINPVKVGYKNISEELKSKSHTYLMQKEMIEKLDKENRVLRKYLLDQTHYLKQVGMLYKKLPSLVKLPYRSITLVDTISYVKLNKFNEILLGSSEKIRLKTNKVYGLIQNEVVGGTARLDHGSLYGYLTSNPKCKFSVFIGPKRVPGIAEGVDKEVMAVKYIPKWAEINEGDKVETSGLDDIFFAYIPVGVVKKVIIEGSYKKAFIEPYADPVHPDIFFLITDPRPYLISYYDENSSFKDMNYTVHERNATENLDRKISSLPEMVQTKEDEIDPGELDIPKEKSSTTMENKHDKATEKMKNTEKEATQERVFVEEASRPPTPRKRKTKPGKRKRPSPFDILNSRLYEE